MTAGATSDRRRAGIALCVASACGFGLMAIFAKQAYREGLGVTALLAARFALAAVVFWAIAGVRRALRAAPAARPARRTVLAALALGAVGYSVQAACYFSALRHIDASLTSLLLYTFPALVCCGAVALGREHVTLRKVIALALATTGTALVLLGGGSAGLELTGVLLGLAAALSYSAYILVAEGIVGRIDPWLMGALVATGAALTLAVTGALTGSLELAGGPGAWIWIAAIALLSTVLPVAAFLLGLERVGGATASIVSTVEPVVTVTLAIIVFGEGFGPAQAAGAVLVLAAVVALQSQQAERGAGLPARATASPAAEPA